jgi:hypothetical protein
MLGFYCLGDETSANWFHPACTQGTSCWDPCVPTGFGGKGCSDGFACQGNPSAGYMCTTTSCAGCGSPCKIDDQCAPLGGDAQCLQGQCRASICNAAPGSSVTPTPAGALCSGDAGGIAFLDTICVCPGIMDTVLICNDGSKNDTPHPDQTCTPTEACDQGGTTGSGETGSSTGGGSACVPTGTDCGDCLLDPGSPQGGICSISCGSCKP